MESISNPLKCILLKLYGYTSKIHYLIHLKHVSSFYSYIRKKSLNFTKTIYKTIRFRQEKEYKTHVVHILKVNNSVFICKNKTKIDTSLYARAICTGLT